MRGSKAVCSWIAKSGRDLRLAKALFEMQPPFLDAAAFFCQQAIEKRFKAYLLAQGQRIKKIHDLLTLYNESKAAGLNLEVSPELLVTISEYAVAHRYPGAAKERLTRRKVEAVLVSAKGICRRIQRQIRS